MNVKLSESHGVKVLEGSPGEVILTDESSIIPLLETCFSNRAQNLLLYTNNIDPAFFNLGTGLAGIVLQKFRNYQIRFALVKSEGFRMSNRFSDLLIEESRGSYFKMFPSKDAAESWLRYE